MKTLEEADDISEEAENIKLLKLHRRQQHPYIQVPILSTSSLSHVFDSIYNKNPTIMVYNCPRCYSRQLESCAAQLCNILAGVIGDVVRGLRVVVLVGLVCALLGSVRVPHSPRHRCYMYLELSVIIVSPILFLLLTQWLC